MTINLRGGHIIFSNYIPPEDSIYFKEDQFTNFPSLFNTNSSSIVIGGGDINCRVGDISQNLPLNCHYRKNPDLVKNKHGKTLLRICGA